MTKYTLPDLDYDYSALEPHISAEIMELHHKKHHNTYVTKLNEALEKYAEAQSKGDMGTMISLQAAIKFNGGGHLNHSIFWKNLSPNGGGAPSGALAKAIDHKFGSFEKMKEILSTQTTLIQGSGWGWLGYVKASNSLCIHTCSNQDPLISLGITPLLGIDVWEHAYYLQYKNVRPDYVKNIWNIINWKDIEARFEAAQ